MEGAHPDFLDQLHAAAVRRRGSAFSAPPPVSDPAPPAGKGSGDLAPYASLPASFRAAAFWLAAPLIAIGGLIALELAYRAQEAEHEPY